MVLSPRAMINSDRSFFWERMSTTYVEADAVNAARGEVKQDVCEKGI